jgi:hypothetical protein
MSYFADGQEVRTVLTALFERFLASADGELVRERVAALPSRPVLDLYVKAPDAVLSVDFDSRTVSHEAAPDASVRLEVEADVLHDVLLERLDPVQISRPFEEDRAAIDGTPEALVGLIRVAGLLPPHYRACLVELGRADLLDTPAPANGVIWHSDGPPKRVIGARRPWMRERKGRAQAAST